ncbi:MAG: ATP-binding cassette domain-containing protein [Lentisphaerae bacterium]|nr:ATP-binding cassette domain-containing protein [Lentisphaerota bacterium]
MTSPIVPTPSTAPLLQVEDVRVWFPIRRGVLARTVGHVRAVDGVSLHVNPGETLALVGESGCGKTTLARAILRLESARAGRIRFEGRDLATLAPADLRPLRRHLQVIFQDPYASLNPRMTVQDIVTEGLVRHGLIHGRERESEALRLLSDVGLGRDALHRYPHEFSGGQRQRISVARAVSLHPKLIICDEPVSALDVSVQAQVLNLLMDLRDKYALSYLFISHDLGVVRQIADRTAVMYLGRLVETGRTDDILENPRHPYTRALISAIPRAGQPRRERIVLKGDVPSPARPPSGCRFHPRCPYATAACRDTEPPLVPHPSCPDRPVACIRLGDI